MRVFMFFINAIFWFWVFIVPAGVMGLVGFWLYIKTTDNLPYSILITIFGIIIGIVLAELVRKKYGLDSFFGRLLATPDIDGENILDEKFKNETNRSEKTDKQTG